MDSQTALIAGASIGVAIAAPIGPMAIIVIRRTLADGFLAGLTTGAGASTANFVYASFAIVGFHQVTTHVQGNRKLIDVALALILTVFAIRMLRPRAKRLNTVEPMRASLLRNYGTAVLLNLANPMSIALLMSAIAAVADISADHASRTGLVAVGVFSGSIAWWICLVGTTALIGIRLSPRSIRLIDIVAAVAMVALAISRLSRLV